LDGSTVSRKLLSLTDIGKPVFLTFLY
jgi:hypothetical protein